YTTLFRSPLPERRERLELPYAGAELVADGAFACEQTLALLAERGLRARSRPLPHGERAVPVSETGDECGGEEAEAAEQDPDQAAAPPGVRGHRARLRSDDVSGTWPRAPLRPPCARVPALRAATR